MNLKNLKQLSSGKELKEYCEGIYGQLGLEESAYDQIISQARDLGRDLLINKNLEKFEIAIMNRSLGLLDNILFEKEDRPEKRCYVYSNLSDLISYLMDRLKSSMRCNFEYIYDEVDNYLSCWDECEEEFSSYNDLYWIKSHIDSLKKYQSYIVSYSQMGDIHSGKSPCPEKSMVLSRLRYLIHAFLKLNKNAVIKATGKCGGNTYSYDLVLVKEFKEFVLSLDTFDTIDFHCTYWNDNIPDQEFSLKVSEPKEDIIVVSFTLIEIKDEDFPDIRTEKSIFRSYNEAKDEYDRLIKPYVDKYGPGSNYKIKNNEFYREYEEHQEQCAYGEN